jgi:hypothetical protein
MPTMRNFAGVIPEALRLRTEASSDRQHFEQHTVTLSFSARSASVTEGLDGARATLLNCGRN